MDAPLPENYYDGTDKISGGKAPSAPVLSYTAAQLKFDFTASIDPESGGEVGTYYVYVYNSTPETYYLARDVILTLTPANRSFYYTGQQTGTRTVIVTGYDGGRESAITSSNRYVLSFP